MLRIDLYQIHRNDHTTSLDIQLSDDEVTSLIAPYTPRYDFQGVSDDEPGPVTSQLLRRAAIRPTAAA